MDDRWFLSSPPSFDPSIIGTCDAALLPGSLIHTSDIFGSLSSGATLVAMNAEWRAVPRLLYSALHRNRVSIIQCTPSLLRSLSCIQLCVIAPFLKVAPTVLVIITQR